jgi:hypothetical protein
MNNNYSERLYEPRADPIPYDPVHMEPLKESIDNLFAKVIKKIARGRNFSIAHQILTSDDPEKTKLPIWGYDSGK